MNIFQVRNLNKTFQAVIWARNSSDACAFAFKNGAHNRSKLIAEQISKKDKK